MNIASKLDSLSFSVRETFKRSGNYRAWSRLLEASSKWSDEQMQEFRLLELRKLLLSARNIAFYKKLWNSCDFDPNSVMDCSDILSSPIINKNSIRANISEFPSKTNPFIFERRTSTGGSSGTPLVFIQPLSALQKEQAFIDRIWRYAQYLPGDRIAVLRGKRLPNRHIYAGNYLYLSGYFLTASELAHHIEQLNTFKPEFIHCYPSLLYKLAVYIIDNRPHIHFKFKAAFCGSETLYPHQRELIKNIFDCEIIAWYGMSEQVTFSTEMEDGRYFFLPQYSLVEFEKCGNDLYEVIGTGWLNGRFPFIRYRTGDYVSGVEYTEFPHFARRGVCVKRILGREQEQVIVRSGESMPFNHMIFSLHGNTWKDVLNFQFIQEKNGILQLTIVPSENTHNCKKSIESRLYEVFKTQFRDIIDVHIEFVDEINNTGGTKAKYFRSNLFNGMDSTRTEDHGGT